MNNCKWIIYLRSFYKVRTYQNMVWSVLPSFASKYAKFCDNRLFIIEPATIEDIRITAFHWNVVQIRFHDFISLQSFGIRNLCPFFIKQVNTFYFPNDEGFCFFPSLQTQSIIPFSSVYFSCCRGKKIRLRCLYDWHFYEILMVGVLFNRCRNLIES